MNIGFFRNFFSSSLTQKAINPVAFFRLYDPGFATPHFLPISLTSDNMVFSWPKALIKSIRLEDKSIDDNLEETKQELIEKEQMTFPLDPLKKADHLINLSSLHLELLHTRECENLLENAVALLRSLDSMESTKLTSDAYQQLAIVKQLQEKYSAAVISYQESLKQSSKVFRGFQHPSQVKLYAMLGMAYATTDQLNKFENCYKKIISIMKTCFSDSPNMWIDFESDLALIYQKQERYHEAILLHEHCCEIYNKISGEQFNILIEKNNFATTLMAANNFTQAKACLEDASSILSKQPLKNRIFFKIIASNLNICIQNHIQTPRSVRF